MIDCYFGTSVDIFYHEEYPKKRGQLRAEDLWGKGHQYTIRLKLYGIPPWKLAL